MLLLFRFKDLDATCNLYLRISEKQIRDFMLSVRIMLLAAICFWLNMLQAQIGPGGVGNSTNNALWLKANAGTSTTTSGSAVSSWNDQSGNANHVSQTTAAQQPLFQNSIINGMPAIQFDNNSTAGQNDYLSGADASNLDNTAGFTIFSVVRPSGTGNARSIVAKRTNVGVNQAYMFFFFTSDYLYADVASNDNRFDTNPVSYAANSNYLMDLHYDGSLAAASRCKIYVAQTLVKTATETNSSLPDYASPLVIGSTHVGDNRAFNGYISEVIIYREALNSTKRIIVDNYLSSKYAITLNANDYYTGDNAANGERDYDVAGIGQFATGDNHSQFDPSACAGLGLTYKNGFNNGDFVFAGHNLVNNTNITSDLAVVSGGPIHYRWNRIWYIDVTNTGASLLSDLVFDLSDGGFTGLTAGPATNYKLLYRASNSGNWTIAATANSVSGDQITFSDFSFGDNAQDGFYTIGTLNNDISPLPIELLSFNANWNVDKVDILWSTATETNNDYFTIERSVDGQIWQPISIVDGAGNSNQFIAYSENDPNPLNGISYYRLKQTDFDGMFSYSEIVAVEGNSLGASDFTIFPNPINGNLFNLQFTGSNNQQIGVIIHDMMGKTYYSKSFSIAEGTLSIPIPLETELPSGIYLITVLRNEESITRKIIVL